MAAEERIKESVVYGALNELNAALERSCATLSDTTLRQCLFCSRQFAGWRELYNHMFHHHGFNVGRPENLIDPNELYSKLKEKLDAIRCIYCNKQFSNHMILRKHMRKKKHVAVNQKDTAYDRFFVSTYVKKYEKELNRVHASWDTKTSTTLDGSSPLSISGPNPPGKDTPDRKLQGESPIMDRVSQILKNQSLVEKDEERCKCLFCDHWSSDGGALLLHYEQAHDCFSWDQFRYRHQLGFYACFRAYEYLRRAVVGFRCPTCSFQAQNQLALEHHFRKPENARHRHPPAPPHPLYQDDRLLVPSPILPVSLRLHSPAALPLEKVPSAAVRDEDSSSATSLPVNAQEEGKVDAFLRARALSQPHPELVVVCGASGGIGYGMLKALIEGAHRKGRPCVALAVGRNLSRLNKCISPKSAVPACPLQNAERFQDSKSETFATPKKMGLASRSEEVPDESSVGLSLIEDDPWEKWDEEDDTTQVMQWKAADGVSLLCERILKLSMIHDVRVIRLVYACGIHEDAVMHQHVDGQWVFGASPCQSTQVDEKHDAVEDTDCCCCCCCESRRQTTPLSSSWCAKQDIPHRFSQRKDFDEEEIEKMSLVNAKIPFQLLQTLYRLLHENVRSKVCQLFFGYTSSQAADASFYTLGNALYGPQKKKAETLFFQFGNHLQSIFSEKDRRKETKDSSREETPYAWNAMQRSSENALDPSISSFEEDEDKGFQDQGKVQLRLVMFRLPFVDTPMAYALYEQLVRVDSGLHEEGDLQKPVLSPQILFSPLSEVCQRCVPVLQSNGDMEEELPVYFKRVKAMNKKNARISCLILQYTHIS